MTFFANLEPIIASARAKGNRVFLLAHSMGNWALQAAVESWFAHGNGDALLFDEVILAAADEIHSSFEFLPAGRLSALDRLSRRISTYASDKDVVLDISMKINFAKRLGQDGAHDRSNQERFPPDKYRTVMCGGFRDYAHQPRQLAPVLSPLAGRAHGHRQHDGGERLIQRCLTRSAGRRIRTLLRPPCLCLAWPCARPPARPVCSKPLAAG